MPGLNNIAGQNGIASCLCTIEVHRTPNIYQFIEAPPNCGTTTNIKCEHTTTCVMPSNAVTSFDWQRRREMIGGLTKSRRFKTQRVADNLIEVTRGRRAKDDKSETALSLCKPLEAGQETIRCKAHVGRINEVGASSAVNKAPVYSRVANLELFSVTGTAQSRESQGSEDGVDQWGTALSVGDVHHKVDVTTSWQGRNFKQKSIWKVDVPIVVDL